MTRLFRSLGTYNYRLWFFGATFSNIGHWMQSTALHWVVLTELTNNDASAMGIALSLQFIPPLLLAGLSGWMVDRYNRRKLLVVTQALRILLGASVGSLLLLNSMTLWGIYGFAILLGIISALDQPARHALVSDLVIAEHVPNAVSLNAASMNAARLVGPAVAGLLIVVVGTGWVFILTCLTFVATILALIIMRSDDLIPVEPKLGPSRLTEGYRYIASRPDLKVALVMVFMMSMFAMNFPIYASTMTVEFDRDADGYGTLSSILAIGALTGALIAARQTRARMSALIGSTLLFAISASISAIMPTYWSYAAAAMVTGFAVVTMMTTSNGYIQTTTIGGVRGRVLAIYSALLMGGTAFGSPFIGAIAAHFGARSAILVGASGAFVAFIIGMSWLVATGSIVKHPRKRHMWVVREPKKLAHR